MRTNTKTKAKTTRATHTIVGKRAPRKAKAETKKTTTKRKPTPAPVEVTPAPRIGSVVPKALKAKAGKEGIFRNDALGEAVRSAFLGANSPREACDAILLENGLDQGRWEGKNPGMLRMNLTNVLRGMQRNEKEVRVRGKRF